MQGITPLTPEQFFAIPNGEQVFNHGADQCVALANEFNEGVIGAPFVGVDSAFQWWTEFSRFPGLVANYTPVTDSPQYGDIFVGRYGIYNSADGHIGVVARSWDGSTFGTMEQNTGSGAMRYVWRHDRDMRNILGFLRPINQQPFNPATGKKRKDMMFVIVAETGIGVVLGEYSILEINPATDPTEFAASEAIWGAGMNRVFITADQLRIEKIQLEKRRASAPQGSIPNVDVNVDGIASAIADKLNLSCDCGCGVPAPQPVDVTTKQDILTAIEANYPGDK